MAIGSPIDGPNDAVQNNVLFIHYGVAGEGDLIPGFPWFVRGNLPTGTLCPVLSERRQGVACGVACSVAERPCSLRRRRHDGKVTCRRIQLMRQTGSARVRLHCVSW